MSSIENKTRESDASLVVIADPDDTTRWLLKWNTKTKKFSMLGGKVVGDENRTQCAVRELGITFSKNNLNIPLPEHVTSMLRFSRSESVNVDTVYHWDVFRVEISKKNLEDWCFTSGTPSHHYWATEKEIHSGITERGFTISDQVKLVWSAFHRHAKPQHSEAGLWEQLRKWLKKKLNIRDLSTENAFQSWDIGERKLRYRVLDRVLSGLGLRHVPRECSTTYCRTKVGYRPKINLAGNQTGSDEKTEWLALYQELHQLIRHDDQLNWTKFHYVLAFNVGLFTLVGYLLVSSLYWPAAFAAFLGIIVAWQADLTFQEGLRCLRAHRAKLNALESALLPGGASYTFQNNPFNQRDALEMFPAIKSVLFAALLVTSIWMLVFGKPTQKSDGFKDVQKPAQQTAPAAASSTVQTSSPLPPQVELTKPLPKIEQKVPPVSVTPVQPPIQNVVVEPDPSNPQELLPLDTVPKSTSQPADSSNSKKDDH